MTEQPNEAKTAKTTKSTSMERLDPEILDEVEEGVRQLKDKIVYEYVEQTSTLTLVILVAIFGGLAFTFFKVNKLINKAHMF